MPTHVAMLRGINVGGKMRVAMRDLVDVLTEVGATEVRTYVQSGNAVFTAKARDGAALERVIEERLRERLGLSVRVLVRSPKELEGVVTNNPFGERDGLHVTFLTEKAEPARVRAIAARDFAPDEFRVVDREVYVHCPDGYGRTKLNNAFFEKQLGVAATTRNWKSVTALRDLAHGHAR